MIENPQGALTSDWKSGLVTAIRESESLGLRDKLVLGALVARAEFVRQGLLRGCLVYSRSAQVLARDAHYGLQTVYASLNALESAGYITRHGQSGTRPSVWEVHYARITDEPPF